MCFLWCEPLEQSRIYLPLSISHALYVQYREKSFENPFKSCFPHVTITNKKTTLVQYSPPMSPLSPRTVGLKPAAGFWMKTSFVQSDVFLLLDLTAVFLPSLPDHSAKIFMVHHVTENQSEDGGSEMVLETIEATSSQPTTTTTVPATSANTITPTTSTTTTSTITPTTINTQHTPAYEKPAPTIVLVLDNSNNNSRPTLHRAGTCSMPL